MLLGREPLDERTLFWRWKRPGGRISAAVRRGPWKLVLEARGLKEPALFNLAEDMDESNDLAERYLKRVERMKRVYERWEQDVTRDATAQPTEKMDLPRGGR